MGRILNCTVKGLDEIWNDVRTEVTDMYRDIDGIVLPEVGSEMIHNLQRHIDEDFYAKYNPTVYPRRKDNPQFGLPLDSTEYMNFSVDHRCLVFTYEPRGDHSGKMKDTLNWKDYSDRVYKGFATGKKEAGERPIKPNPVHGDTLIRRLQTAEGYDWDTSAPPRPFWNNFVDEQIADGIVTSFGNAINSLGKDRAFIAEGWRKDVLIDGDEYLQEASGMFGAPESTDEAIFDTEDELPF